MILAALDLLRTGIENDCECRAMLADLGRDFLQAPDAIVLTLIDAQMSPIFANRPVTDRRSAAARVFPDLTVLAACWFRDYSVALRKLADLSTCVVNKPMIGPMTGEDGQEAMVRIVPAGMTAEELTHFWQAIRIPCLPSLCVRLSVSVTDR